MTEDKLWLKADRYEHDTERWLRSQAKIYALRQNTGMAATFERCADDVKKLRMAVDLHQQGAEHMREELAKVRAELDALKEAARELKSDLFYQIEAKHGPKIASEYPSIVKLDALAGEE